MNPAGPPRIPVITGPTAVGKTAVSLIVARAVGAEIVSSDSRQIYRDLEIGTAKPSRNDLAEIRHHLVDEFSLDKPYSAGIFSRLAELRISDILHRGNMPIVSGGSTLYLQALIRGLADIPDIHPNIRLNLNERLQREGSPALLKELKGIDPAFAATVDKTKSQRILRGLEVALGTGKPLSDYFREAPKPKYDFDLFILTRQRTNLYERINKRVDEMVNAGLFDEVSRLHGGDYGSNVDALKTIGYSETIGYLKGMSTAEETVALIKKNSRRYAKRQLTWFRQYDNARWFDLDEMSEADVSESIVRAIDDA